MLYKILKNYTLQDALNIENNDRQFLAYKNLYENKSFSDEDYLFLILQNALISFQLSWKGEDYHEEFCFEVRREFRRGQKREKGLERKNLVWAWNGLDLGKSKIQNKMINFYKFFEYFLKNCKNNRRFVDMKLKRIEKSLDFYDKFSQNIEFYYKNMDKLAEDLAKIMNQKKDAKTIVFAVKLFSYWARNIFWYVEKFPENLMIPIDSRLENLYKKSTWKEKFTKKEIKQFYIDLSKQLNIPLLHLDAILWVNYDKILKTL